MFSLSDTITCVNNTSLPPDLLACPLVIGQDYEIHSLKKCRCGKGRRQPRSQAGSIVCRRLESALKSGGFDVYLEE